MKPPPVITLLLCLVVLGGCTSARVMSHVPISTIKKFWNFDPSVVDPGALRVAARMPHSVMPRPGGVRLMISVTSGDGKQKTEHRFILKQLHDLQELAPLKHVRRLDDRLYVFRLTEKDEAILRSLQDKTLGWRSSGGGNGRGSISAAAKACRRTSQIPDELPVTIYLKTHASDRYTPLIIDLDMNALVAEESLNDRLPLCESTSDATSG